MAGGPGLRGGGLTPTASARRRVVLDEPLDRRLARELRARGRDCESVYELGLTGLTDAELLARLGELSQRSWVLVTTDDALPSLRAAGRGRPRATLAILDPRGGDPPAIGARQRELLHRWAHAIQGQPAGSVRRYGTRGGRPWRERRRPDARWP